MFFNKPYRNGITYKGQCVNDVQITGFRGDDGMPDIVDNIYLYKEIHNSIDKEIAEEIKHNGIKCRAPNNFKFNKDFYLEIINNRHLNRKNTTRRRYSNIIPDPDSSLSGFFVRKGPVLYFMRYKGPFKARIEYVVYNECEYPDVKRVKTSHVGNSSSANTHGSQGFGGLSDVGAAAFSSFWGGKSKTLKMRKRKNAARSRKARH